MKIKDLDLSVVEQFIILELTGSKFIKNKKVKIGDTKIYLIASIFIDLSLNNKLSFGENQEVIIKDSQLTGIEYNDVVLELIKSKEVMNLKKWIEYFYSHPKLLKNIYNSIIESFIKKGALEVEKTDSFLSTSKKTYIDSKDIGDFLIQKLRAELLEYGNIDTDTMYLATLLDTNKMLMSYFSEYEYQTIKDKMETIYQNEESNKFKVIKKSITTTEVISIVTIVIDMILGLL